MLELLPDPRFDLDIFNRMIKNLIDCVEVSSNCTRQNVRDDTFERDLVRGAGKDNKGFGTLHVKNIRDVLLTKLVLCEKGYIMFHPKRKERLSDVVPESMITTIFNSCKGM